MRYHSLTVKGLREFWISIVLVIFLSGCGGISPRNVSCPEPGYALIIDAGSSGSRLYVYRVEPEKYDELPGIILLSSKKVTPGISAYDDKVKNGLINLVSFAKDLIEPEYRKDTALYVLATAGMRLLPEERQTEIIQNIREIYASDNSFDLKTVKVISGADEGLYSWLAVNYLDDRFEPAMEREGMIEMGGAQPR